MQLSFCRLFAFYRDSWKVLFSYFLIEDYSTEYWTKHCFQPSPDIPWHRLSTSLKYSCVVLVLAIGTVILRYLFRLFFAIQKLSNLVNKIFIYGNQSGEIKFFLLINSCKRILKSLCLRSLYSQRINLVSHVIR